LKMKKINIIHFLAIMQAPVIPTPIATISCA
jgi:hypothetical protein